MATTLQSINSIDEAGPTVLFRSFVGRSKKLHGLSLGFCSKYRIRIFHCQNDQSSITRRYLAYITIPNFAGVFGKIFLLFGFSWGGQVCL